MQLSILAGPGRVVSRDFLALRAGRSSPGEPGGISCTLRGKATLGLVGGSITMSPQLPLPALLGGEPVRPEGPPDWPGADESIALALSRAVTEGSWGKYDGGHVRRLEARLAEMFGVRSALVCSSGTFAVELALRALLVGPGSEVVLSAYDYSGNYLSALVLGATPVLVDVDAHNWNMDPARLAEALTPGTKAVIVSHLHGGLAPMREIRALTDARGVPVVEDAAQAPGATVQGRPAGGWGAVGILSFGGSKLLTAGRGGAILTSDPHVYQRARVHQFRGNTLSPLSELQAVALLPQLDALPARHARRLANASVLRERLREAPGLHLFENRAAEGEPAYYKLGLQLDAAAFGLSRERFVASVRAEGIALDEGFRALHVGRSPGRFRQAGPLPEAERAHACCVVLHHPVLLGAPAGVEQVGRAIEKVWAYRQELAC
jgi:dTDP-4-amino-4,6-dideoxygalactose transaminase